MAELTNFYVHFGANGVNQVHHNSVPKPPVGVCVPIQKRDAVFVAMTPPNMLMHSDGRIFGINDAPKMMQGISAVNSLKGRIEYVYRLPATQQYFIPLSALLLGLIMGRLL